MVSTFARPEVVLPRLAYLLRQVGEIDPADLEAAFVRDLGAGNVKS